QRDPRSTPHGERRKRVSRVREGAPLRPVTLPNDDPNAVPPRAEVESRRVGPPPERRQLLVPPAQGGERSHGTIGNEQTRSRELVGPRIAVREPLPRASRDVEERVELGRREPHLLVGEQRLDDDARVVTIGQSQREMSRTTDPWHRLLGRLAFVIEELALLLLFEDERLRLLRRTQRLGRLPQLVGPERTGRLPHLVHPERDGGLSHLVHPERMALRVFLGRTQRRTGLPVLPGRPERAGTTARLFLGRRRWRTVGLVVCAHHPSFGLSPPAIIPPAREARQSAEQTRHASRRDAVAFCAVEDERLARALPCLLAIGRLEDEREVEKGIGALIQRVARRRQLHGSTRIVERCVDRAVRGLTARERT